MTFCTHILCYLLYLEWMPKIFPFSWCSRLHWCKTVNEQLMGLFGAASVHNECYVIQNGLIMSIITLSTWTQLLLHKSSCRSQVTAQLTHQYSRCQFSLVTTGGTNLRSRRYKFLLRCLIIIGHQTTTTYQANLHDFVNGNMLRGQTSVCWQC